MEERLRELGGFIRRSRAADFEVFEVRGQIVREALARIKDEGGFRVLIDITALDEMTWPGPHLERFAVVYLLRNPETGERVRVKAWVSEAEQSLPSATPLWRGADWPEREVFDMFGIRFEGHPDLRRILMPDDYGAYPLRKDYPVQGRGERDAFPKYFEIPEEDR
jgi:NADH-quinone oxidoreductase subunit C